MISRFLERCPEFLICGLIGRLDLGDPQEVGAGVFDPADLHKQDATMIAAAIKPGVCFKRFGHRGERLAIVPEALVCHTKINVDLGPDGERARQHSEGRCKTLLLQKHEAICCLRCRKVRTDLKGAFQRERSGGGITCGQLHRAELVMRIRTIP